MRPQSFVLDLQVHGAATQHPVHYKLSIGVGDDRRRPNRRRDLIRLPWQRIRYAVEAGEPQRDPGGRLAIYIDEPATQSLTRFEFQVERRVADQRLQSSPVYQLSLSPGPAVRIFAPRDIRAGR